MKRSWVEISRAGLRANVRAIRERLSPSTEIIAVVKANAYGHGMDQMARCLFECGIREFAVAVLEEAVPLRRAVPQAGILVLEGCLQGETASFVEHGLTAALFEERPAPPGVPVEVKVDTGMSRLGVPWQRVREFMDGCGASIRGVYSHFACSERDPGFTRLQLERFEGATGHLTVRRHIANSAGLALPEAQLDAVRIGLALYGISPCPAVDYVRPVMSWKSRILSLRRVARGNPVGYCGTFRAPRDTLLGIVSTGYSDGYRHALSNRGQVRVRDRLVPVVGRVAMDLLSVDLTSLPDARAGEEVVLMEAASDSPISASGLAGTLDTIPYEILTGIASHLPRVYI